ncbi:MAG: hypothetical protein AAFX05_13805 [Planctomycetota bacterium]
MRTTTPLILTIVLALLASTLLAGGCNYVGAAFVLASGPPKVQAVVELDDSRSHVIFIDDLNSVMPRRALRDVIGQQAEETLLRSETLEQQKLIASSSARRAAAGDTIDARLAAVDVARLVGAEVMVYVTMTGWTLEAEPGMVSPWASCEVRLLDAVGNQRIWPDGERTHPLVVQVPSNTTSALGTSIAERSQYEDLLARRVGDQLAKLFFTHEREKLSEQMRP